ncbi:MAG: TonB-dependent receptor [Weeksellaceae bacterium]|nr:TonB-dependent receptor [Weeksellaceae bacterium]
MNLKYSKCLGLAAVLYFTANYSAQQVKDTVTKETTIEEVVVIGYGTQKKSNVTGAISSLKASDIEDMPAGKPEQVLQGRAAGVSVVTNSGQPGSTATVRVRGVTSFGAGSNDPLWVVDGIVVDGIGWLNQSDIENIEVLKDGASAAIYGVSAAKGVVLVTTKKGSKGKLSLNYNGFFGVGNASRKLDLLNATQYATIMNEARANDGKPLLFSNPSSYGEGTDWQNLIFNSAQRESHEVSVSSGSDKSTFYASFGYYDQQGIVLRDVSYYKRLNGRINSTHKVTNWLTVGQTFAYTHTKSEGVNSYSNTEYGGPLSSAINLDPITPGIVNDMSLVNPAHYTNPYIVRDPRTGNPYGISPYVQQEITNPLGFRDIALGQYNYSDDFVGNAFVEIKPVDHFTLRSTMNGKLSYWGSQGFTPLFYLSPTQQNTVNNRLNRVSQKKFEWSTENTLTYQNKFGLHSVSALVGQGYYEYDISSGSSVTYVGLPITSYQDASFNFDTPTSNITASAWDGIQAHKASYFGRLIYDFDNRYLLTGTIRRDGSSRFGANNHWGNFPSFSLGWNVSNESFWKENKIINSLKLRGGYGVLGNDNFANFMYASFVQGGNNYTFIDANGITHVTSGYAPTTLENPDLHWEETKQTNIAADIKFLNNFDLTVDFYQKKTTDILRQISLPGYIGATNKPWRNIGDMNNKGIETSLGYKKQWNDFGISVNGNFAYLKNEITKLEDGLKYIDVVGFQSMGAIQSMQVGYPYSSFWGHQTAGIFQNQSEINSYVNSTGQLLQPNAKPGDFRWVDSNGDGKIDQSDRAYLGNSLPKYTFGFTVNLNYKNFDLMVFAQGQAGNKIFQGLRRLDIPNANFQTAVLDRWVGEGSTNSTPRATQDDPNHNLTWMSDYYLQKGDYLRIKLVQVGYTLPKDITQALGTTKIRFYVTGENLFTFTKYTGFDPEIAGGDTLGVDRAYYPQARTVLFGANVQF